MRHYVASESINDNENSRIECYMLRSEIGEQRTLNQRVQGSSPCAPTIEIKDLLAFWQVVLPRSLDWEATCEFFWGQSGRARFFPFFDPPASCDFTTSRGPAVAHRGPS